MKKLLFVIFIAIHVYHFSLAQTGNWKQLIKKGDIAYKERNYEQAIKYYELACPLIEKTLGKQHPAYANSLNNLAKLYRSRGSYAKAESLLLEALPIREKTVGKQHLDYYKSLDLLAKLYNDMGRYGELESLLLEILQIREKTIGKEHPDYAESLEDLAWNYQLMRRYYEAEPLLLEALQIREKTAKAEPLLLKAMRIREKTARERLLRYALSLRRLSMLYNSMGYYDQSKTLHLKALEIVEVRSRRRHRNYAAFLEDLALNHRFMGSDAKAVQLYQEARQIREKTVGKQHPSYATSLEKLAQLYKSMDSYAKAERCAKAESLLLEALQIREKTVGKEHSDYAESLEYLAELYGYMDRYSEAEPLLLEALQIRKKTAGKKPIPYVNSLNYLIYLYNVMGSNAKTEPLLVELLQIEEKMGGKQFPGYDLTLIKLAKLYRDMGSYDKAEPLFLEALRIREKASDRQPLDLAELYQEIGSYEQAETLYLEVHEDLLRQIKESFPNLSEKGKLYFYERNIVNTFERFHAFALKRQTANPQINGYLYNNLLAIKGLLFQSQNKIRNAVFSSSDSSLKELYHQWQEQRNILAKVYQMSPTEKQRAGIDQAQLEKEVNDLEKQLSNRSESFARAADKTLYTWQQVQQALKPGEAAVEMIRYPYYDKMWTDTTYAALVLTPALQQPACILLANGKELESTYSPLYHRTVQARDIVPGKPTASQQADPAQVYQQFWQPLAQHPVLQGVKTIYFSADGVYHQLNLNTLFNPRTRRYLLDELDIHLVSSTRDLLTRNKKNPSLAKATLLGYPAYNDTSANEQQAAVNSVYLALSREAALDRLFSGNLIKELPGTKTEVTAIGRLLSQLKIAVDSLTGTQATEAALKQVRNPNILHIATHGYFLNPAEIRPEMAGFLGMDTAGRVANPLLRSGLLLAGCQSVFGSSKRAGNEEDGVLTAYEAMSLNLDQTDLVVLSACETALGEIRNGEGVYGLQRAFQTAGAKAVLMSLWKVDDAATQQLMTLFYQHWLTTRDVRSAFRQAQQELRKEYPQPYFWGAFVLIGE